MHSAPIVRIAWTSLALIDELSDRSHLVDSLTGQRGLSSPSPSVEQQALPPYVSSLILQLRSEIGLTRASSDDYCAYSRCTPVKDVPQGAYLRI